MQEPAKFFEPSFVGSLVGSYQIWYLEKFTENEKKNYFFQVFARVIIEAL